MKDPKRGLITAHLNLSVDNMTPSYSGGVSGQLTLRDTVANARRTLSVSQQQPEQIIIPTIGAVPTLPFPIPALPTLPGWVTDPKIILAIILGIILVWVGIQAILAPTALKILREVR